MQAIVTCPVFPTEDEDRVKEAVLFLFPDVKQFNRTETAHDSVNLQFLLDSSAKLGTLRTAIHDTRIIDAVRVRLEQNRVDCTTSIALDKQAASSHKLRIIDEADGAPPLGCIKADLQFDDEQEMEQTLHWIVPPTRDGRVVHD